jgi:hypothetical protein
VRYTTIFIAIILFLFIPLSLLDYALFPYSDGAEHGAAVREAAKSPIHPEDPMLAYHRGDSPRFVPSTLLMALFTRLLGLDVLITLKIFLVIYSLLFLVAAALFSREYFNDAGQAPWSLAALLFLWGSGWTGANAYMFSALLYTAYFPSLVSFSLSLLALYFQLRFLHSKKTGFLITEIILGSLAFVNHPLTGVFFFICSGLLYVEKRGFEKKMCIYYLISVVGALLLMVLWPYYSFFQNFFKIASGQMAQTADYQSTRHYLYSMPLLRLGSALAGIPFLIFFLVRKRHLLLAGGFIICSLIYLIGYVYRISLTERFVFFIAFFLQMAVSRILREGFYFPLFSSKIDIKRVTSWGLLFLLTLGTVIQLVFLYTQFISPAFERKANSILPAYVSPNTMQLGLKKYLGDGDVVLSDIYSSWSIPVYTGAKIIALFHTPPNVIDNTERIKAVATFYDCLTTKERRKEILKKYKATHIYLNFLTAGEDLGPMLNEMGLPVVARGNSFCLFSVTSDNLK